ncbi:Oxysterol-binding protein-related protein 1C [Vitis vinifera]|uniref:Oxysterol-binding protein-related protein 1C n=1 Tax=Vitis vinifera TaxID=29760 RepID=A0A438C357_VITVI|nr:Oxysterol-binding protein-related protein 1C [Vitis vinifera]
MVGGWCSGGNHSTYVSLGDGEVTSGIDGDSSEVGAVTMAMVVVSVATMIETMALVMWQHPGDDVISNGNDGIIGGNFAAFIKSQTLDPSTEKVDLENTLVDESQRQLKEQGASSRLRQDKYSEVYILRSWTPSFNRPFNDWEMEEVGRLLCCLDGKMVRMDEEDRVRWVESKDGVFSPKISFFAWEASWGRVLTLDHLQKRGWALANSFLCLSAFGKGNPVRLERLFCGQEEEGGVAIGTFMLVLEGSGSESEDDNERVDAAEEETDDDDNTFFDTRDFLSSSSFKSTGSDFRISSFSSDDDDFYAVESEDGTDPSIICVGKNYPHVKRRNKLPDPVEKEKGVSLWSMIKDNIGKDLTKVCLPVYFNEPLSSLQKCFEDLEYSYLLDRAHEWGKMGNSLMRILNVAAFAVSGYASTEGRTCKPFNPLLGETYEADYPDKGLRFFSEKVSHHPMIVACHCEGTGWKFWADSNLKSKFWGRSIQLDPIGALTLEFDDGETFQWSKVTTSIYNLILGKLYCDHYGTMRIQGNREYSCKLKFKEQSIIDRNPHQDDPSIPSFLTEVQGIVQDRHGKTVATLFGKWDESMHYVIGDCSGKGKGNDTLSESHLLWKQCRPPKFPTRYNLTRFAITLNELTPGLKEKLPPTDSRLRPDQRCLENGEYEKANSEKLRLEQRQRQSRKMQERGWKPRWFVKDKGSDTYRYVGGYWEAREKGNWDSCPDIFGQISTDQISD